MSGIPQLLEDWRWGFPEFYIGEVDEPLLIHPNVYRCVAFIDRKKAGKYYPAGTAFQVKVVENNLEFYYWVTARHVIERTRRKDRSDDSIVYLRFSYEDGKPRPRYKTTLTDWKFHPTTDSIDAAVLPFRDDPDLSHTAVSTEEPQEIEAADRKLGKWHIGIGTDIFVVGLFTPHHKKNDRDLSPLPILRTGTIARICDHGEAFPDEDVTGREIVGHLVELHSIAGLSGAPVFACPMELGGVPSPAGLESVSHIALQTIHIWFGLVSGHWPGNEEFPDQHLGISLVTPRDAIIQVLNHPKLLAMRQTESQKYRVKDAPRLDESRHQNTQHGATISIPSRKRFLADLTKATRREKKSSE